MVADRVWALIFGDRGRKGRRVRAEQHNRLVSQASALHGIDNGAIGIFIRFFFALTLVTLGSAVGAAALSSTPRQGPVITVQGGQQYEIALDEIELQADQPRDAGSLMKAEVQLWDGVSVRAHGKFGTTLKLEGVVDLQQLNGIADDLNQMNPGYKARFVLYPPGPRRINGDRRLLSGYIETPELSTDGRESTLQSAEASNETHTALNTALSADPTFRVSSKLARLRARAAMYGELHRQDKPEEAQNFFALKRAPQEPGTESADKSMVKPIGAVPAEKYLELRETLLDLPRFSTATGQALVSQRTAEKNPALARPVLGSWTSLGPGNIGGRTRSILIDPVTPTTMYAAGVAGGVWKTTNGGSSWTPLTDTLPNLAVSSMAMVPGSTSVIYAGTGEGFFNVDAVRGAGIFKTTDAGATWTQIASTANSSFYYVNKIVVSPNNTSRIYAATRSGLYRSLDSGGSWTQVIDAAAVNGCLDVVIRTDQATDYMFASCGTFVQGTVYKNTDAGGLGSWTPVLSDTGMGRTSLALAPSSQSTIYAMAASTLSGSYNNGLHAVFRSTDSGATWTPQVRNTSSTKLNTVLMSNPVYAFLNACYGAGYADQYYNQGWYDNVIAVDPVNPNRVWAGGIDLFRSDDGGANWGIASYWWADKFNPRYAHADQHAIVFHPQYNGTSNKVMFVGNDGGIHKTSDATAATVTGATAPCNNQVGSVNWTTLNNGYGITQFYNGTTYPGGAMYFAGAQDNGTLRGADSTGANAWSAISGGDGGYVALDRSNTNTLYVEYTNLSIQKSTDGGGNFVDAISGITESSGNFLFINPFTMDPSNSQRLWTGGYYLWRTTNGATSWTQASAITPGVGQVSAIAVAPTSGDAVLAGMSDGYILRTTSGLSTTSATTWANLLPRAGYVSSLTFDPTNANIAYATYSTFGGAHVWKSTNGGATWTSIDGSGLTGIPDVPVHSLVVDPSNTSRLYVGTDVGVFVSRDGGATWYVEVSGFANVITEWLTTETVGGVPYIYAFTHGRGVWRVPLADAAATAPSAPTNVTAIAYPGRIQVSFTPPTSDGGSSITGYTVSCSAAGQTTRTNTGTTSPISVTGLTAGVAYACSVTAANGVGSSSASAIATVTAKARVDLTPILMLLLD